jgi:hypothetical protein
MQKLSIIFFLLILILSNINKVVAQQDTSFVKTFPKKISIRVFGQQKYTRLLLTDKANGFNLKYYPNTNFNLGIGATYKSLTLGLAYGFGFINSDEDKGDTRYLDIQIHRYALQTVADIQLQLYKGFYLYPRGTTAPVNKYYLRPDIQVASFGFSLQYLTNYDRFSYRASFLQNEIQKKSAGSGLLGFEAYLGGIATDSTIVPTSINKNDAGREIKQISYLQFGPNGGYAYTFVYKKHWFITGALSISLPIAVSTIVAKDSTFKESAISPNSFFRLFAGYNADKFSVSLAFINNVISIPVNNNLLGLQLNAGSFRISLVKRFQLNKKIRKQLDVF